MCQFQAFYLTSTIAANNWLNLAVARELHSLLCASRSFRKYEMPSTKRVMFTALSVYAHSCFIASWALWADRFDNFPHRTVNFSGMACLPLEYSRESSIFYYSVYIQFLAGIPFFAIFGMGFHIWYRNLMPPTGRRRTLAIFFGRIMAVFAIMFQGAVSAALMLTKPDIRDAFCRLIRCRFGNTEVAQSSGTNVAPSLPLSRGGTAELSCNEVQRAPDSASPRHIEPFQNELDRLDNMSSESSTIGEMVVEENDELACWPR